MKLDEQTVQVRMSEWIRLTWLTLRCVERVDFLLIIIYVEKLVYTYTSVNY